MSHNALHAAHVRGRKSVPRPLASLKRQIIEVAHHAARSGEPDEVGEHVSLAVAEFLANDGYAVMDYGYVPPGVAYVNGHEGNESFSLGVPKETFTGKSNTVSLQVGDIDAIATPKQVLDYWCSREE